MIKLKPSEIHFWQEALLAGLRADTHYFSDALRRADDAVHALRARIDEPGPRPDAGRL